MDLTASHTDNDVWPSMPENQAAHPSPPGTFLANSPVCQPVHGPLKLA